MFDKLDKLRKQPPHVRRRAVLLISGGITAVIFAGWLTLQILTFNGGAPEEEQAAASAASTSPFASFGSQMKQLGDDFGEVWGEFRVKVGI